MTRPGRFAHCRDVMTSPGNSPSRVETGVSLAVLLCLLLVAGGVFREQFSFNPAVLALQSFRPQPVTAPGFAPAAWLPPELKAFGAPEHFTPDNLYDKIDGKAELYLASGFVELNCQRFALTTAPDQWLEWFVYNMGGVSQAFSVFTVQRRAEGQPLDLADFAYRTRNALYFVCGSNYVEAVASATSESLMRAMTSMARRFVQASGAGHASLPQLALLPGEDLVPGSYTLQSADVFGFDQFKDVYTAEYAVAGQNVLAFVTRCPNPAAASTLRDAYRKFLLENGGKTLAATNEAEAPIEILGAIELVFSQGNFVAGIHAAPSLAPAEKVAARLRARLHP
jgi:hypothetical protein